MILIDTDVGVDLLRKHPPALAWVRSLRDTIAVPGYAAMEILGGCRDAAEVRSTLTELAFFDVRWPSTAARNEAMMAFASYRSAHGLGLLDSLIAQTAVELDVPLHTFNVKHFAVVPRLRTVQPYRR